MRFQKYNDGNLYAEIRVRQLIGLDQIRNVVEYEFDMIPNDEDGQSFVDSLTRARIEAWVKDRAQSAGTLGLDYPPESHYRDFPAEAVWKRIDELFPELT